MVSWSVDLLEYDIQYATRGKLKSQDLPDFVAKLNSPIKEETPSKLALYMDNASNVKGSGVIILLVGPRNIVLEQALKLQFTASKNQAEYKAFIIGMVFVLEMRATGLIAKSDSQMVTNKVS